MAVVWIFAIVRIRASIVIRTGTIVGSELTPEWFEVVDNVSPVFADQSAVNRSGH